MVPIPTRLFWTPISDVEVHEHGPISIQPNERVTMGKRHRKAVLDGISKLNKHDMMIQNGLELIPHSNRDCQDSCAHFPSFRVCPGVWTAFD